MTSRHQALLRCAESCAERAWRLAYSLMRNVHDADDVVQQAFVVAARKHRAIPQGDPWPWFGVVVMHEARNARRKRKSRHGDAMDEEPAAAQGDPDQALLDRELREALYAALDELSEAERDALVLTKMSGMSYRDAAAFLGVPMGTFNTYISRGLERLRARLKTSDATIVRSLAVLPAGALPPHGMTAAQALWLGKALSMPIGLGTVIGGVIVGKYLGAAALILAAVGFLVFGTEVFTEPTLPVQSELHEASGSAHRHAETHAPFSPSQQAAGISHANHANTASAPAGHGTHEGNAASPSAHDPERPPPDVASVPASHETVTNAGQATDATSKRAVPVSDRPLDRPLQEFGKPGPWVNGDMILSLVTTPDGRFVVTGSRDARIRIWDATSGEAIGECVGHQRGVSSLSLSRDGRKLLSGSWDGSMKLWDLSSRKELRSFNHAALEHEAALVDPGRPQIAPVVTPEVTSVALSPDATRALSASSSGLVAIWDLESGVLRRSIYAHESSSMPYALHFGDVNTDLVSAHRTRVLWTPAGDSFISGGTDGLVKRFSAHSGELLASYQTEKVEQAANETAPDADADTEGTATIELHGIDLGAPESDGDSTDEDSTPKFRIAHDGKSPLPRVTSLNLHPDGARLYAGFDNGEVVVWDLIGAHRLMTLAALKAPVEAISFAHVAPRAACVGGSGEPSIAFLDTTELALKGSHTFAGAGIHLCADYSLDDRMLFVGTSNGNLLQVPTPFAENGQPVMQARVSKGHERPVVDLTHSPDGRFVASAGMDSTIRVWNAATGEIVKVLSNKGGKKWTELLFSPDSAVLLAAEPGGSVSAWNTTDWTRYKLAQAPLNAAIRIGFAGSNQAPAELGHCTLGFLAQDEFFCAGKEGIWHWRLGNEQLLKSVSFSSGNAQESLQYFGGACFDARNARVMVSGIWSRSDDSMLTSHSVLDGKAFGNVPIRDKTSMIYGSPQSDAVVLAYADGSMEAWELSSKRKLCSFEGHNAMVTALTFDTTGQFVVSGHEDGTIRTWDLTNGSMLRLIVGHVGAVRALSFEPLGSTFTSAGEDRVLRIWSAR